jgi:hypothetical protein
MEFHSIHYLFAPSLYYCVHDGGLSFSRSSSQSNSSRSRVCSPPMLGGGVRFCRWSVAPLWLDFPSGAGDAEVTTLQRNNFSQFLLFSDGDLL